MALDRKAIDHLALLARLELTDEEKRLYAEQLSRIVTAVEKVNALDLAGVEPLARAVPVHDVFRDDVVLPSLPREKALAMSKGASAEGFIVPQVLAGGES